MNNEFLQKIILGNSVKWHLILLSSVIIAFLIKKYVSKYIASVSYQLIKKRTSSISKENYLNLLVKPIETLLFVFVILLAVNIWIAPLLANQTIFKKNVLEVYDALFLSVLIALFIWVCIRIIDFVALVLEYKADLTADATDNQLIIFFKDFFKVLLFITGVLLILHFAFNKDVSSIITGLSIVGAAVALATKESLENLIASFIIFFDKPFTVGNTVKVGAFTGTVEKIGLRSTRLRTDVKTYISVPNKQMVDSIIDNISLRTQRKTEIRLELDLTTTSQQIVQLQEAIKLVLKNLPAIDSYTVFLTDTGKQAHILAIDYFSGAETSMNDFNELKEKVGLAIISLINQQQIKFAVPIAK